MSDDKKIPSAPPPDDYSKTTPNINLPGQSAPSPESDWDKTNYNYPKQPSPDEWGRTVANIKPIDTSRQDHDKTFFPGAQSGQRPSVPEWGMTDARVDVDNADFGTQASDFGAQEQTYGKTTPYFTLPEAERAKYQNLPPTPTEQQAAEVEQAKKGVPGWIWTLLAMFVMFFVLLIGIGLVWVFFFRPVGFSVSVKGAPPGSTVKVDNVEWGVTDSDGSIPLQNLKAGTKQISIVHPNYKCEDRQVQGKDGDVLEPIIARCQPVIPKSTDDCTNFHPGEFDKAEQCYYKALGDLPDPFTAEQLISALNILIINFDSGKFNVPPQRMAALQKGAEYIKKLQQTQPGVVLEVGGHTDNVGSDASNQPLSENRAKAVRDILVNYGVNSAGLQVRGYGSTQPRFPNDTDQNKFLNRRIEYKIVKK